MASTGRMRQPTGFRQTMASGFILIASALTIATVLMFQYVGGYMPCHLCLEERIPFYLAIPIAIVAYVSAAGRALALLTRLLLLLLGLIMLVSLGLAVYHAGVEWNFWAGPTDCAAVSAGDLAGGDLLSAIDRIRPPSCDEAAGRFLGLSFAGWNALVSAVLAAVTLRSAFAKADRLA